MVTFTYRKDSYISGSTDRLQNDAMLTMKNGFVLTERGERDKMSSSRKGSSENEGNTGGGEAASSALSQGIFTNQVLPKRWSPSRLGSVSTS